MEHRSAKEEIKRNFSGDGMCPIPEGVAAYKLGEDRPVKRKLTLSVDRGPTGVTKDIPLPAFGEVKIITHGRDIRIETTTKEKVE